MAAPSYSPYLQFNPDFAYGGKRWGANDLSEFQKLLRKRGVSYNTWARRHPNAAKVFDPVEQQVYGLVQPQLDAINYERQKASAASQRRMHDLAGFTQAIMGMLGEISPAVRGAYGEGAETMSAGGRGFGDILNTNLAANAAKGNSLLDVLGSGQRIEGGDAGSVLAGLAGWLPSEMLSKQGAAYGDAFAQLPKEASFQAQIEMRHQLAKAAEEDEDFSSEIMGILKGMPSMRAEIQAQREEMNLAQQKFRLDQIENERDYWMKQQALLLSQGKYKLAKQAEKRAQAAERRYAFETAGRDAWGNPKPGYTLNPNTGTLVPPDYHVDKQGNVVKNSSKSSGFTPTQRASMLDTIDSKEDDIKAMIATAIQNGEWFVGVGPPVPGSRAKLAKAILAKYGHLAGTPTAKKRLRALVARLLKEAAKAGASGSNTGGSATIVIPEAP